MYHPTSRVLTVLAMLQARPFISGPELAARLEMDVRTVRRYITHLQDIGIPIEASLGRQGGYRLRPGYKLPPLMFTEDEAVAVMLGLLGNAWLELGQPAAATAGALAKVTRVLPPSVRERLDALSSAVFLASPQGAARPDVSLLLTLTQAICQQQRIDLAYLALDNHATRRTVEPYGIVGWDGHWYLVGYCCLRQGYRSFRLDRMQQVTVLEEAFERPPDFDCRAYLAEHDARIAGGFQVEVEFAAALYTVQQQIPPAYGTLTATPTGTLYRCQFADLDGLARYLVSLGLPFVIHDPPELRAALLRLAEQMAQIATAAPAATPPA